MICLSSYTMVNVIFNTWNQIGIYLLELFLDRTPEKCELGTRATEFWIAPTVTSWVFWARCPILWSSVFFFINLNNFNPLVNSLILFARTFYATVLTNAVILAIATNKTHRYWTIEVCILFTIHCGYFCSAGKGKHRGFSFVNHSSSVNSWLPRSFLSSWRRFQAVDVLLLF